MLAYNIWRSFKMLAEHSEEQQAKQANVKQLECSLKGIMDNTIRIAGLKLLFIAAKIPVHSGTNKVKYSQHDSRAAGLFRFMGYPDKIRQQIRPWLDSSRWACRHLTGLGIQPMPLSS